MSWINYHTVGSTTFLSGFDFLITGTTNTGLTSVLVSDDPTTNLIIQGEIIATGNQSTPIQGPYANLSVMTGATVFGEFAAMYFYGGSTVNLINSGSIVGAPKTSNDLQGAILSDMSLDLINDGVIENLTMKSGTGVDNAITIGSTDPSVWAKIANTGVIHGDIQTGYSADYVQNAGVIHGLIFLGEGDDTFVGIDGFVDGSVFGGLGDDNYYVDDATTSMFENVNEGFDEVYARTSFKLGANFEALFLQDGGNFNGTGNELDNYLQGNSDNNILRGKAGNDSFVVTEGVDTFRGGADRDAMGFNLVQAAVTVKMGSGVFHLETEDASFETHFSGIEIVIGGDYNDKIIGDKADNVLFGSYGNDVLKGGAGDDEIIGSYGRDVLAGGKGADLFTFYAASESAPGDGNMDVIKDFKSGEDQIVLTAMGSTFIGKSAFSNTAGEVRYSKKTGILEVDSDGDSQADFAVRLQGGPQLVADDLIF